MRFLSCSLLALSICALSSAKVHADQVEATLKGHAILPAQSLIQAPENAPEALRVSGKFAANSERTRTSLAPTDGEELPFNGQPLQGFSGIKNLGDGLFAVLTDNGFGNKRNSPDTMLFFHFLRPDFESGEVKIEQTVFLSDPDKLIPFPIVMEGSETRYLTGSDLDIEGFQIIDGNIFIGDEFGPYVIAADVDTGFVKGFTETISDGETVRSPDHMAIRAGNPLSDPPAVTLNRSRGFEGFAKAVDDSFLYPMLEGALFDPEKGVYEEVEGQSVLRILELDPNGLSWTGRSWFYPLEDAANAIGDFNMIDETRGLVIERDWGMGDAELACKGDATENCFEEPALFKRVYLIDFEGVEDKGVVKKTAFVDLLDIKDPDGIARSGKREDGRFTFPFVTIENVDRYDENHIIVGNDNNFPFSKGRLLDQPDDNEFILLETEELFR